MHKIIIGIGIIAVIAIGWLFLGTNTAEYTMVAEEEVSQLETELIELEAAIAAGRLSPGEAAAAQTKIATRIDAINSATTAGQQSKLTDSERAGLAQSLERLKQALMRYKDTLNAVDEAVLTLPESERPKLNRRGGGSRSGIAAVAAEAIETAEEQIEEIIADITDADILEEIEETMTASSSVEMSDDTASSSEPTMEDTDGTPATGSEEENQLTEGEVADSNEQETSSSSDDSSLGEIETEADLEVEAQTSAN